MTAHVIDWAWITACAMLIAAGISGALVRSMFRTNLTWIERLVDLANGGLMALFTVPAIHDLWYSHESVAVERGLAFVIGVGGPSVIEIVIRAIDTNGDSVANRLIRRVTGVYQPANVRKRRRDAPEETDRA